MSEKTIQGLCNRLKEELLNTGYEYGFFLNGKTYKPDIDRGFDKEFNNSLVKLSRVQDPVDTVREKVGTCIDAVVLMKSILSEYEVSSKIWLVQNRTSHSPHTVLTFEAEGKIIYLELTPQSKKPWYGKEKIYEDEKQFIGEWVSNNYSISDVTDAVIVGERPDFILSTIE